MWQEETTKSQARLDAMEQEREHLLRRIGQIQAAKESYNATNAVRVSAEMGRGDQGEVGRVSADGDG